MGWKLYGDQAGEPVYFGEKAEGKFGCYFVKDKKVRALRPPHPKCRTWLGVSASSSRIATLLFPKSAPHVIALVH